MSLKITKAGILDTVQDMGRYGYQHLGINPGGAMDRYAAQMANILTGNAPGEALIEMHFPALSVLFEKTTLIALTGADFEPVINGEKIPLLHPVIVNRGSVLQFQKALKGARCYLAVYGGLELNKWLGSYSTNMKAAAGGYYGRPLQKGDRLTLKKELPAFLNGNKKEFKVLPWKTDEKFLPATGKTRSKEKKSTGTEEAMLVIRGNEWKDLTEKSQHDFLNWLFHITTSSDRMGYRMKGPELNSSIKEELVTSVVSFGTIQLLPDGQLIILMADHQTSGGYPRVAHVISTHLSWLAQKNAGEKIHFELTDQLTAENLLLQQQQHLLQLENACKFRLEEFLKR